MLLVFIVIPFDCLQAQTLKVELSPDKSKVDRSVSNGTATIFFDSNVDDLSIVCTEEKPSEPIQKIGKMWFMHVDAKEDIEMDGFCYRNFLLKSPSSAEYYLTTPEIGYNQVLYYTVVLPNQFLTSLTVEYLFTKTSKHGFRLSFGKRFGGYISYKWGDYKKAGTNIGDYKKDTDVSHATFLGYIRNSYTAGFQFGINNKKIPIYVYLGGGYGEYGRQWQNIAEIDRNIYFHSDYLRGFEGEIGISCILLKYFSISVGTSALFGNGKISVDYQIGLGLNLYTEKLFRRKVK